jgi:hypothetical protein
MNSVAATSPTTKTPEPPSGSGTPEAAAHATSATETSAQAAAPETAAPETAAPETAAPEPEPEPADQATSIQVHGLGSFGAITSFKQSLERVDGVRSVTLGLGASGEFVYTATHAAAFDLTRAIRAIEGEGVEIERDNGMLRVKVGKAAQAG